MQGEQLMICTDGQVQTKVGNAIKRLQSFEPPEGYYVAFSGGKDSQCIYHLCQMAGVKFDAHYNVTSVDPPELVHFIKRQYPDVIFDFPRYADGSRERQSASARLEHPGKSDGVVADGNTGGGQPMTPKRLSALLVLALAAIALTVCAGLADGRNMWSWIVGYWAVLTAKNIVDWIGRKKE